MKKAKYFSIQADVNTDCANKEEVLLLALSFDPYTDDAEVHVHSKFLLFATQGMVQQQAYMNLL